MRITKDCIQRIKEAADIVDVCQVFIPDLKKSGQNYIARSPKTNEKTPSFHAIPHLNKYKDFSHTKQGETFGDAVNFLMVYQNMTYVDALEWLANRYGIPVQRKPISRKPSELEQTIEDLYKVNEFACQTFQEWLTNDGLGSKGLDYLQVRGVSPELIERYRLGYAPDAYHALLDSAKSQGYSKEILRKAGLIKMMERGSGTHYYDSFRDRVMFPITDVRGRVLGFGGRLLPVESPEKKLFPKYVNSHESNIFKKGNTFFGLSQALTAIRQEGRVYLVEGYMDVLAFASLGIFNVVSLNGTALKENAVRELARYTRNFVIVLDGDAPGQKAIQYILPLLLKVQRAGEDNEGVRIVSLPEKLDPDEYVGKYGEDAFRKLLSEHKGFVETLIEHEWAHHNDNPNKRARILSHLIQTILYFDDTSLMASHLVRLSELTGVNMQLIQQEAIKQQEAYAKRMEAHWAKLERQKPAARESKIESPRPVETLFKVMLRFGHEPFEDEIKFNEYILKELEDRAVNIPNPDYRKLLMVISNMVRKKERISREDLLKLSPSLASQIETLYNDRLTVPEMAYKRSRDDIEIILNSIRPALLDIMIERLNPSTEHYRAKLIETKATFPQFQ